MRGTELDGEEQEADGDDVNVEVVVRLICRLQYTAPGHMLTCSFVYVA